MAAKQRKQRTDINFFRIGEVHHDRDGREFKIVEYNNYQDITLEFIEDKIRYHIKNYADITRNKIRHPHYQNRNIVPDFGVKSGHPLYNTWKNIYNKCCVPNTASYPYYGAKGITYDPRWDNILEFTKDLREVWGFHHILNNLAHAIILHPKATEFNKHTCIIVPIEYARKMNFRRTKGVSPWRNSGRWRAYITVDGSAIHLGYFDSKEEAEIAYMNALQSMVVVPAIEKGHFPKGYNINEL